MENTGHQNEASEKTGAHRLAAIMFTDIQGYTAVMQRDEKQAVALRNRHRTVFKTVTAAHHGEILQYYGDGTLSIFSSTIDAVRCAVELQKAFQDEPKIPVRIGIHSGDIIVGKEDVIGDSVNIAARIESFAVAGSVCISGKVHDEIKNQPDLQTRSLGKFALKNVDKPQEIFVLTNAGLVVPEPGEVAGKGKRIASGSGTKTFSNEGNWGKWLIIIGFSTALLVSTFYFIFVMPSKSTAIAHSNNSAEKSIAVLPFKTIGEDPEGAYFAEGVREEILSHLTRIEALQVKSRSVVDNINQRATSLQEVVSELGLTHYLEGSARKEGDLVRISVKFIDASNNQQLWMNDYNRPYENIWATQSEIARKIADELQINIAPRVARAIDKKPTENPEAWDDFLKAMYYGRQYIQLLENEDPEQFEAVGKLVTYLRSAVRRDSNFAIAHAWLARTYRGIKPGSDSIMLLINRAIELDPELSAPYIFLAEYNAFVKGDSLVAVSNFEQAISNDPHLFHPYWSYGEFFRSRKDYANALVNLFAALQRQPEEWDRTQLFFGVGQIYMDIGDFSKAEYYLDRALISDPDNLTLLLRKSHLYRVTGQHDALLPAVQKIMEIAPEDRGQYEMAMYYFITGDYHKSVEYFDRFVADETRPGVYTDAHTYAFALKKIGRDEDAEKWFARMQAYLDQSHPPTADYEFAKLYAAQGKPEEAYDYLEQAAMMPLPFGLAEFMSRDPLFTALQNDLKFQELVDKAKAQVQKKKNAVREFERAGKIPDNVDGWIFY